MAHTTWDEDPQPRRAFRWKGWLLGLGVVVGLFAMLGGIVAGMGTSNRRLGWPLLLNVASRLQTDEGARDLWTRNPALADTWASEDAFLAMARKARPHLPRLPKEEPRRHMQAWISSGPEQLRVLARVPDGPWLHVYAHPIGGQGEGIFGIRLEEDPDFEAQFKVMTQTMLSLHRRRMERILSALATDAEAMAFLTRETGLDASSLQPWLTQVQAFRPQLPELRKALNLEASRVRRRSRQFIFHQSSTLEFQAQDGAGIRLEYAQGRLTRLAFKQPGQDW